MSRGVFMLHAHFLVRRNELQLGRSSKVAGVIRSWQRFDSERCWRFDHNVIAVLAIFNARIIRAIGARWTGVAGIIILGIGELISSFYVKSLAGLFIGWGLVGGIGTRYVSM